MSGIIPARVFLTTSVVFVNPASVIAMLTELFTNESWFFATDASVDAKGGECGTAKSLVILPPTEVFVVDGLVFAAISEVKTTFVDSPVVRGVVFPAPTDLFFRPGKVPVIRTSVVAAKERSDDDEDRPFR